MVRRVHDATGLVDRLDSLADRVEQAGRGPAGISDLEDLLATGYAGALAGEVRMMRLERQLEELLDSAAHDRARELRLIVREQRALERAVGELRAALARLQAHFVALGGAALR
jgi:hypothetical protein